MDRRFTNIIKFIMDECVPPIIRDTRWFMYPFYFYAYRGKNISEVMNLKSRLYDFSAEEYAAFYNSLDTISRNRLTDLSAPIIKKIIAAIPPDARTVLDAGCGHGYLLNQIKMAMPAISLTGCDVKVPSNTDNFKFINGSIDQIDQTFDTVICCHTIEHIVNVQDFVRKLKSMARRRLIIVVPCQREFYYTIDEHINFFPYKAKLTALLGCRNFQCEKICGDWLYIGEVS